MKQILGTSYNIEDDIVGRITFGKGNLFRRSNDILVCKDATKPAFGYLATITESTTFTSKETPYCIVDSIEDFYEGDVVVINKQGEIIFVYEINSNHNALMQQNVVTTAASCAHSPLYCKRKTKHLSTRN